MPETTIKDLQTDYARIGAKVQQQEQALSPDAIATASVSDLAATNGEILADVQALREKLKAAMIPLSHSFFSQMSVQQTAVQVELNSKTPSLSDGALRACQNLTCGT